MTQIRSLIVDDEEGSRHTLRNLLNEYCPQVEIVGLADSPAKGLKMILEYQPELVFLDIRMPAADEGFQLLESIEDIQFAVIFTTSYDEYAIRAIKFSALDYLLKPINILELQKAVNRYLKRRGNSDAVAIKNLPKPTQAFQKLGLPSIDGLTFVDISEIIRCEADGNCTVFHTVNRKKILVTKTLKYYEDLLVNSNFYRIHGSHLINLKHIAKYKKEGVVELSDGSEVYVSARKKKAFIETLNNLKYRI
ncbi:MAG: LytTR family DNA-binding domain-containing protein [Chitinophagales bacterium]